jgi:hypothetical protein
LPLPWAGVRPASPRGDTWHVGYLSWRWGWLSLPWAWARPAPPLGDTWHVGYLSWRWGWLSLPWAWARLAPPLGDTWRLGCLPLSWVRPEHHVALKLACPCPRLELACAPTWGHLAPGLLVLAMG